MASGRDDSGADPAAHGPAPPDDHWRHPRSGWGEIEEIDDERLTLPGVNAARTIAEASVHGSAPIRRLARLLGWCITLVIVVPMLAGIVLLAVGLVASLR